ncbi:MAG TPA: hemerythrin domain-containing protein [Stenomitos sp.]
MTMTTTDLTTASVPELTAHIRETHHEYLRKLLPRLQFLVNKIRDVHGGHHPELAEVATIFNAFVQEMSEHIDQEEELFFPKCEELAAGGSDELKAFVREKIAHHTAKHESLANAFVEMRRLSKDFAVPEDGCSTYQMTYEKLVELETDTQQHLSKENDLLIGRMKALV